MDTGTQAVFTATTCAVVACAWWAWQLSRRSRKVLGLVDAGLDPESRRPHRPSAAGIIIDPFEKFIGGFEGTFANVAVFFGGLDKLIGVPRCNVAAALRDEHCGVVDGFGASDTELVAPNYGVRFTPREEYLFVADPAFDTAMSAGTNSVSRKSRGERHKVTVDELLTGAVVRLQHSFRSSGWNADAVTERSFAELHLRRPELVAMRLYTGPMYILYNGVLRGMATPTKTIEFGVPAELVGARVDRRFVTPQLISTLVHHAHVMRMIMLGSPLVAGSSLRCRPSTLA